jgi:hypothetical protein
MRPLCVGLPQSNSRTLINIALGFIAMVLLYLGIKALWSAYVLLILAYVGQDYDREHH